MQVVAWLLRLRKRKLSAGRSGGQGKLGGGGRVSVSEGRTRRPVLPAGAGRACRAGRVVVGRLRLLGDEPARGERRGAGRVPHVRAGLGRRGPGTAARVLWRPGVVGVLGPGGF